MKEGKVSRLKAIAAVAALCMSLVCALPQQGRAETTFKAWGDFDFGFNWTDGTSFTNERESDNFGALQRVRLFITARTSETLSAMAFFRLMPTYWGQTKGPDGVDAGFGLDADGVNMRMRLLFLNWQPFGDFWVQMGIIPLDLPFAGYRNGILDTSGGGVAMGYSFTENLGVKAFWARPYDGYANDGDSERGKDNLYDEMDLFYLGLPFSFPDAGLTFNPWVMHARIGRDSNYWNDRVPAVRNSDYDYVDNNGTAWWTGLAAQYRFDRFVFSYDAAYGHLKTARSGNNFNADGWFMSAALDYKLDWGTPGLFGWYGTGSKADDVRDNQTWGYLPSISTFGDGFAPTSFGFKDEYNLLTGGVVSWVPGGRWGVGVQIEDISIWQDLSHVVRVAYYQGTNDEKLADSSLRNRSLGLRNRDGALMTTKDSAVEVNFDHLYKVYENLDVGFQLGYIKMHRGSEYWGSEKNVDDAWAVGTNFHFTF